MPERLSAWLTAALVLLFVTSIAHAEEGTASWYGPGFCGHRTASGERFNCGAMTAASKWRRLGSQARVTNLGNGRSVTVRITDRGPWLRGRVIDLSPAAARAIGLHGLCRVRVD